MLGVLWDSGWAILTSEGTKQQTEVIVMAALVVVVVALLYIPMGILPVLPRDIVETVDRPESGL